ncbi:DUF2177 family protein [Tanticharoenia sakaeratensis]|uniref:Transmembrane protein n=1 Tax=Tanticharoenia sakaeratensis NBRC 103193 TaxID=1231623 RepID=A0A0D6MH39_9PROT|nr:DUF2177 family protein [Tanticharoenia sakaeratensis]GAN52765.1 hypothetical protein Tasa_002_045 [Tanticharoenia sakaeratensis NBRC 103193]GBQ17951.1 hypothetical protein AA103193_0530 [Tanticharoenia sakaeratensis NBRC 103193]
MPLSLRTLSVYICTLAVMLALDAVFLGLVAMPHFKATLGGILNDRPRLAPAIAFYVIYAMGLVVFAGLPHEGRWSAMAAYAAAFGFVAYATYDLTNYATLRPWTGSLVAMDLIWGTTASTLATLGGAWIGGWLSRAVGG